jgi:hypothetical protein
VLEAYFDESGIQGGDGTSQNPPSPVCVVAGYFGGYGWLKKLGKRWSSVLRRYNIPEFHAKEFWGFTKDGGRIGPYKGWSDSKADVFLNELVSIIENHYKVHPVASAVVVGSFNALAYNKRRFLTGGQLVNGRFNSSGCPGKPYFLPFQVALLDAADYAPVGGKVNFFFDLNKNFKGYALDVYALIKQQGVRTADRLGEIVFPTGLEAVQLQAADLLCYESFRYALKRKDNPTEKHTPLLSRLLKNRVNQADTFFDTEYMELLCKDIPIPPG